MDPQIVDYLMKLRDQRDRQAQGYIPSTALADANDNNAFLAALDRSASQIGSVKGKQAGSTLGEYANQLAASNAGYQKDLDNSDKNVQLGLAGGQQIGENLYKEGLEQDKNNAAVARQTTLDDRAQKNFERQDARDNRRLNLDAAKLAAEKPNKLQQTSMTDDAGNPYLFDAASGSYVPATAPEGLKIRDKTKAPNGDQYKAAGFAHRVAQSMEEMEALQKEGYNRASRGASLAALVPDSLASENTKRQDQAERNFVNAVLRRESGAAISKGEFTSAEQQYFPRSGDTPEVLAQKDRNRQQTLASLKAEGAQAYDMIPSIPRPPTIKKNANSGQATAGTIGGGLSVPKVGDIVNGHKFVGGDPTSADSWEEN